MKSQILIIIASSIFSLFNLSCSEKSKFYRADMQKTYQIEAVLDTLDGSLVYQPDEMTGLMGVECIDSLVILFSDRDDSLVMVYDASKDSVVSHFGHYGNARNELLAPIRYAQLMHDKVGDIIMYVQDENRSKMYSYNLTASMKKGSLTYAGSFGYSLGGSNIDKYRCYAVGGESYILHRGVSGEGDVRDAFTTPPSIILPCDGGGGISMYPQLVEGDGKYLRYAYNIMSQIKPDFSKMVEAHGNVGLFTIVNLATRKTIGVKDAASYSYDYLDELGRIKDDSKYEKLLIYITHCNVSENYIAICQDGRLSMKEYGEIINYQPIISLFDWEGEKLCSFVAREPIMRLGIDEGQKCLYGLSADNSLYKYELEHTLKRAKGYE